MEGDSGRSTARSLIESIRTSNVVESRISLISQLRDPHQFGASDLALIIESLPTLWDDSTCSSTSSLILNKTVLHGAAKCLELDTSSCLSHFLILATKASMWCRKHLQMMIVPSEESLDEKSSVFCQLIVDSLTFSSATMLALTRSPLLGEKVVMLIVENFISEQLNVTKASISEIKKNHPYSSEVIKVAQVVLDASIKLCRAYYQAIKWHSDVVKTDGEKCPEDGEGVDFTTHIISMTACTVEHLYELGILAAASGGSLVTVLNVSWKGVVSLLQLGKRVLADKIDIGDILLTLLSLATESLRCSAETWFSKLKDILALSEAKRTFLPIKFYLINAVRISSEYPHQTLSISMGIAKSVLMISCFGISFSKETHLRSASEALMELLEPHSFLLLIALLNSTGLKHESQFQILEWLFPEGSCTFVHPNEFVATHTNIMTSMDGISPINHDGMPRAELLMLGRVILFLNILKSSPLLREELLLGVSKKLGYCLNCLMNEDVYSSILILHIPVLCGSGATSGLAWQPILPFMLLALKTFMIVAASSSLAWKEVEYFLFQNLFHCHFLCVEIVMELWCFFIRHAEPEMINGILDGLGSLLKAVASSEAALSPFCPLRKMARSICVMLSYARQSVVDRFYSSIFSDNRSYCLSIMNIALLLEGFPMDSLSDNLKKLYAQRIITAFHDFIENNDSQLKLCGSSESWSSSIIGLPILFMSAVLHSRQIKSCDVVDERSISQVLKFAVLVIHGYKSATASLHGHYRQLLHATLYIISNMKHLYASEKMREVILELQTLFATNSVSSDAMLYQCKPALGSFMAGLCHMEIEESDESAICSAVQALYHMLLRERHWALIHLALLALEYFAERTTCSQLWRFLPHDAALSFETDTGNKVNEERFMSEFKAFLEKEVSLNDIRPCKEQLGLLLKEGTYLKEKFVEDLKISLKTSGNQIMEIDGKKLTNDKKRKLPGEIREGMTLLQSGLKVLSDGLANTDSLELKAEFSHHLSCLEDVISHLLGLSGGQ